MITHFGDFAIQYFLLRGHVRMFEKCPAGLTSDPRQTRGPVRDTGQSSTNVSQNTVHVIFHPN